MTCTIFLEIFETSIEKNRVFFPKKIQIRTKKAFLRKFFENFEKSVIFLKKFQKFQKKFHVENFFQKKILIRAKKGFLKKK